MLTTEEIIEGMKTPEGRRTIREQLWLDKQEFLHEIEEHRKETGRTPSVASVIAESVADARALVVTRPDEAEEPVVERDFRGLKIEPSAAPVKADPIIQGTQRQWDEWFDGRIALNEKANRKWVLANLDSLVKQVAPDLNELQDQIESVPNQIKAAIAVAVVPLLVRVANLEAQLAARKTEALR